MEAFEKRRGEGAGEGLRPARERLAEPDFRPPNRLQAESLAEVRRPSPGRGGNLLGRALLQDLSMCDDVGAVTDAQGVLDVVVGDEDAQSAGLQVGDLPLEVA